MYKKIFLSLNALLFLTIFVYLGKTTFVKGANCASNCTTKEIGTLGKDAFGRDVLNPVDPVAVNKSYWVKLSVKGQDTTTSTIPTALPSPTTTTISYGSDIMMMLDTTTSMYDSIPVNADGSGGTVLTYEAVRDGMVRMVNLSSDPLDYLGFGSFRLCRGYTSTTTPVWWVYEDWNRADDGYRGTSAIHLPLQPLNGRKTLFTNTINSITILNDSGKNNNFCRSSGVDSNGFHGGTSVGAAITAADTQLTPILNDSKAVRRDGSSYRDSTRVGINGYNDGPRTRFGVPKYIVLATDGGEGAPPLIDDPDIDKNLRSALQTAAHYEIKIYGIAFSRPGNNDYQKLERITTTTGGKIFAGNSRQQILQSVEAIRNEITKESQGTPPPSPSPSFSTTGSTATINERINSSNFSISTMNNTTFKLIKRNTDGSVTNITSTCGSGLAACLSNASSAGFDLKLPQIGSNEEIYVYFMVTPTTASDPGQKVPVDKDPDSIIKYSNGHQENIRNVQVGVVANKPYFESQNGGDIHTRGGLLVDMPDTYKFIRGTYPGILSYGGSAVVRPNNNQLSSKNWKIGGGSPGYQVNAQKYTYQALLATIKSKKTITSLSQITGSGFYVVNGDLTINSTNKLPNLLTSTQQIVLFVNGNVYIRTAIPLFGNPNNKSSLAIISSKNIGIDPAVSDPGGTIAGIYIADGVIDTACSGTFSFTQCTPGAPTLHNSSLTLEGMFLAASGFNLDRYGTPDVPAAGEKFIYRPELLLTAAPQLGSLSSVWQEISP